MRKKETKKNYKKHRKMMKNKQMTENKEKQ